VNPERGKMARLSYHLVAAIGGKAFAANDCARHGLERGAEVMVLKRTNENEGRVLPGPELRCELMVIRW
jgi:hypothetical protein